MAKVKVEAAGKLAAEKEAAEKEAAEKEAAEKEAAEKEAAEKEAAEKEAAEKEAAEKEAAEKEAAEKEAADKLASIGVLVESPKAFTLRMTPHEEIHIKPGVQRLTEEQADHWYSVANGVTRIVV